MVGLYVKVERMLPLQNLLDDAKCYEEVRQQRWPEGVRCPHGASSEVTKRPRHDPSVAPEIPLYELRALL